MIHKIQKIIKKIKKIFIYFIDFLKSFYQKKRYFVYNYSSNNKKFIQNYYFSKMLPVEYRASSFRPQISFFEVHGPSKILKKSKDPIKIFFTGENVHSDVSSYALMYQDNCINEVNLSFGFDYLNNKNYIRFPYWIFRFFNPIANKDEILNSINIFNTICYKKDKFCSLIAAHDKTGVRKKLIETFSQINHIHCPGKFNHNDASLKTVYNDDKYKYLQSFRFNLCPENDAYPGYITEKIFEALWCDCIPIYWGGDRYPEPEVINKNSFIFVDLENPHEALNQVRELETNPRYYQEFKTRQKINDSAVDYIYTVIKTTNDKINELLHTRNLI